MVLGTHAFDRMRGRAETAARKDSSAEIAELIAATVAPDTIPGDLD